MSYALPMPTPAQPSDPSSGARLVATGGRVLPLRHAHLEAEAGGGLCRTILTQRFVNPHAEPLHVTYLLPLPADGAVSGFSFLLGERRIVGEVDTRAKARERFQTAMVEGRTAALLEQDRSSLFTQEVGNVPPGEEIVCEIVIDQPLRWLEEGAWEWRFPTVVGPRYMSSPGVVPDASKVTVPVASHGTGAKSSLALAVDDALSGAVESNSHRVDASAADERTEVRFGGAALDRDVVVRWPVAEREPGATLRCARPAAPRQSGRAYGLLTLVPPRSVEAVQPRDLILLLDTSGSMGGRPLDQLKRVSLALLDSLGTRDRLELIAFGSRPERFQSGPILATRDGKQAARRWVQKLRASGGTEMHTAVLEALRPLREDAQRQVVLMTDGFIGFEQQIVRELLDRLPRNARLHTVGVGSAPNRTLTQAAARAGRGAELIVGLEEDAERAAARLLARTASPLVTELSIEGARTHAPRQLPDLYAGCPAMISVELGADTDVIVVRGRGVDGAFERRLAVRALDLGQGPLGVMTRFGRERVEDLEMELTGGGDRALIQKEIEAVALEFQIASRLTSWIAVTEEVTVKAPSRHEIMPHELPEGVTAEGLGLRSAVTSGDRKLVDELERRIGTPFPADKRARLEEQAAKRRLDPLPMTQSGTMKGGELEEAIREAYFGRAAVSADADDESYAASDAPADLGELVDAELAAPSSVSRAPAPAGPPPARPAPAPAGPPQASPAPAVKAKRARRESSRGGSAERELGAGATVESAPEQVAPAKAQPIAEPAAKPARRGLLLVVLVLLAILIGALAWWLSATREPSPPAPPSTTEPAAGG